MADAVVCEEVGRVYRTPAGDVAAVRTVSLRIAEGSMVALVGRSGSGKTTLLGLIGGLDRPDAGRIEACGFEVSALDRGDLARYRRGTVGFVFQAAGLVPLMTATENVALALELAGEPPDRAASAAREALRQVGLEERAKHRTYELSGGEQQRVAIARALVKRPPLLIADEPTGQLDSETAAGIVALLRSAATAGTTVLVATHDEALATTADRILHMDDGAVSEAAVERSP